MSNKKANKEVVLAGRVKIGLGKGKYFMGQSGYKKQFVSKLGIDPYHGTLNLKLSASNMKRVQRIKKNKGVLIKGFKKGNKTFGDVIGYRAWLYGINCALIMPKMSIHTNVIEIISSEKLREALKLREGSEVKVLVKL